MFYTDRIICYFRQASYKHFIIPIHVPKTFKSLFTNRYQKFSRWMVFLRVRGAKLLARVKCTCPRSPQTSGQGFLRALH